MDKICRLNNILDNEKKLKNQKEMFLATLTHDLKNPVQALLMTLKMFKNGMFGDLKGEQSEILDNAIETSDFMQKMLCSILSTYKLDNGVTRLEKELVDIDALIKKCINENNALASERLIKIVFINNCPNIKLYVDNARLRRVVGNLLNNALNHAYKNTELIIEIKREIENISFSFKNIGNPIPDKVKTHIFEKYFTGDSMTGTGLGLYFSKKVIEAHNGRIYFKNEGNEIIFKFELPISKNTEKAVIKF